MAHLILYDGVCGLCNRLNRFVLNRDRRDRFRFASLQGPIGRDILRQHGRKVDELDTFYLVTDHGTVSERLVSKARAALEVLGELGWPWRSTFVLRMLPTFLLDACYDFIARRRYRWFGKYDHCPLPKPEHRRKFLDVEDDP